MTDTSDPAAPTGETRHTTRRRSFFRYLIVAIVVSLLAGMASGAGAAMVESGTLPPAALYLALALLVPAMIWFTRDYFRRIDELDLLDNLWASTIGLYFYIIAYALWFIVADAELVGESHSFGLFIATLGVTLGAYLLRKLGLR